MPASGTSGTHIKRQALTRHLHVLAQAGPIHDFRLGRERLWEFERTALDEARRSLDSIARQWEHALMRLKLALEK